MALKLCCAAVLALILTLNCNIYAIPLSELLNAEKAPSTPSETAESSETESAENTTVNGTQKDLWVAFFSKAKNKNEYFFSLFYSTLQLFHDNLTDSR